MHRNMEVLVNQLTDLRGEISATTKMPKISPRLLEALYTLNRRLAIVHRNHGSWSAIAPPVRLPVVADYLGGGVQALHTRIVDLLAIIARTAEMPELDTISTLPEFYEILAGVSRLRSPLHTPLVVEAAREHTLYFNAAAPLADDPGGVFAALLPLVAEYPAVDGFTFVPATGVWRGIAERAYVLIIVLPDDALCDIAISGLAARIKTTFGQSSVLVTSVPVSMRSV